MARWKCTMCGYIDEGDEPQERCPICGSPKSIFWKIPSQKIKTR